MTLRFRTSGSGISTPQHGTKTNGKGLADREASLRIADSDLKAIAAMLMAFQDD
jgi:hypothetical protein